MSCGNKNCSWLHDRVCISALPHDARLQVRGVLENLCRLGPDELVIAATMVERLVEGRKRYGQWRPRDVTDGRDYRKEANEELMDCMAYIAAQMVRLS